MASDEQGDWTDQSGLPQERASFGPFDELLPDLALEDIPSLPSGLFSDNTPLSSLLEPPRTTVENLSSPVTSSELALQEAAQRSRRERSKVAQAAYRQRKRVSCLPSQASFQESTAVTLLTRCLDTVEGRFHSARAAEGFRQNTRAREASP